MEYFSIISLIAGGLGLFLFSLFYLGEEMREMAYNEKFKNVLSGINKSKLESFFIGVLFTALIQSSSCASILFLNLVSTGMLTTLSCISAIIGANIGTCVTSLIVSFSSITISKFMPYLLFLFSFGLFLCKNNKIRKLNKIFLLFNLIFFAIFVVDTNVKNIFLIQNNLNIINFISFILNHYIVGFLFGIFATAILQSSSIFIAIIQVICSTFQIFKYFSFIDVCPIIFGSNIGAIMPLFLISINGDKATKRIVFVNFFIKVMTACIFSIILFLFGNFLRYFSFMNIDFMFQISLIHILFNILQALIFFPIVGKLDLFSKIIFKEEKNDNVER